MIFIFYFLLRLISISDDGNLKFGSVFLLTISFVLKLNIHDLFFFYFSDLILSPLLLDPYVSTEFFFSF